MTSQERSSCSALLVRGGQLDSGFCDASPTMCLFSLAPRTGAAAEESGAGKQILLDRGAYKDMDICIMYVAVAFPSFPSFFLCAWGAF